MTTPTTTIATGGDQLETDANNIRKALNALETLLGDVGGDDRVTLARARDGLESLVNRVVILSRWRREEDAQPP